MSVDEFEGDDAPEPGDVVDMVLADKDGRRWVVLYEDDYDDLMLDAEDSVALLVDLEQAGELFRLASQVIGDLAAEDAPDKEPIEAMIDRLQEVADGE